MIPDDAGYVVEKILSANDCGLTGGHQAGALIPKKESRILDFFPKLNSKEKNPRCVLTFIDDSGTSHRFCFIYYNNRVLGCGTRNEYRLTCMTDFIRSSNLKVGDTLIFSRRNGEYHVSYKRHSANKKQSDDGVILVCSGKWKVVQI
jgi:hypothetical protein